MATLNELQIEKIKEKMLHEEAALKIKFKAKNTQFDSLKVLHAEVESYESMGWIAGPPMKTKTPITRKKEHGRQFEDDIWCLFYNLGFRILNSDENLRVQWGDNPGEDKQIDVLAVGKDSIFVVECKCAEKPRTQSFQQSLIEMSNYKEGMAESLRQIYGKDKRVKFIFATRNYRINEGGDDDIRMKTNGIYHLNENSYNYICNLIKSYKETSTYQFLGLMFKNELISDKPITIPALKGKMGSKDYFLFSIEPSTLLKIGFVLHRTKVNDSMAPTYQRLLVPSRLKGITKFIDEGGYFPNSVIINFAMPNEDVKITYDPIHKEESSDSEFVLLNIPNAYGIAYIIDGQHRVYGYANSKFKDKHTIPVVAFNNMVSEEQLKIFMEINENQKAVSPSLRLDLEQDLYWDSDRIDSRMKALRSSIIKALAGSANNILYNSISIGEDVSKLSFKPFDTALSRSGLIPKATATQWVGDTDSCIYNVYETDHNKAMKMSRNNIAQFINGAYSIADTIMNDDVKKDYLFSNRATFAFITLIGSVHKYLIQIGEINPSSNIQSRITAIKPYIVKLSESLNSLSEEENRTIKGVQGQGAETFWLRSFQNLVNRHFPDYCPEELVEWKETQDQTLQQEGLERKADIRRQIRIIVFDRLEMVYGTKWINNVAVLKNEVEGRIIKSFGDNDDFEMSDYDWKDYIEVPEYKNIVDKNFSHPEFEEVFAINIGMPFKSKKEKIAWFSLITETKKKTVALTRSDLNRLELINTHLEQFMPGI